MLACEKKKKKKKKKKQRAFVPVPPPPLLPSNIVLFSSRTVFRSNMRLSLFWVDAFSKFVGAGNPAAVVPLSEWLPRSTLQLIARENGLSETAFIVEDVTGSSNTWSLRWFTPEIEVDLCGHATLAAGFVVLRYLRPDKESVIFTSQSGPLAVSMMPSGDLELDFPSRPPVAVSVNDLPPTLLPALGLRAEAVLSAGRARDILIEVRDEAAVRAVAPDFDALARIDALCIIVCCAGSREGGPDVVSRVFCPSCAVPEDPVTGSAHCTIVPHFVGRLGPKQWCHQASARGGDLHCTIAGDRVRISGPAVLYMRGEIEAAALPVLPSAV